MSYKIFGTNPTDPKSSQMLLVKDTEVINGAWHLEWISDTVMRLPSRYQSKREGPIYYYYLMDAPRCGGDWNYNDVLDKARKFLQDRIDQLPYQAQKDRFMSGLAPVEPKHSQFEVEDTNTRQNAVFVLKDGKVTMYDTTRGRGNPVMSEWGPDGEFPYDLKTAESFYRYLFNKSLKIVGNHIIFIGYVDENFNPIEPDPHDEGSE